MGMYDKYGAKYAASLNAMIHQQALAEEEQEQDQGGGAFGGEIAQAAMGGAPEMAPEDILPQAPGGEHGPMGTPGINPVEPTHPFEPPNPADYGAGGGLAAGGPGQGAFVPPDSGGGVDPGMPPMGPDVIDESGAMGGNPDATLGMGGGAGPQEKLTMEQVWRQGTSSEKNKIIEQFEDAGIDVEKEADKAAKADPEAAKAYAPKNKSFSDLTKKEKGGFLLEFGLRMMQASGNVETTGFGDALGQAGLGTLGSIRAKLSADDERAMAAEQTAYDRDQDAIDQREDQTKIAQGKRGLDMEQARIDQTGEPRVVKQFVKDGVLYSLFDDNTVKRADAEGGAFTPDPGTVQGTGKYAFETEMELYLEAYLPTDATPEQIKKTRKDFFEYKARTEFREDELKLKWEKELNDMLKEDTLMWNRTKAEYPELTDREIRILLMRRLQGQEDDEKFTPHIGAPKAGGSSGAGGPRRAAFSNGG